MHNQGASEKITVQGSSNVVAGRDVIQVITHRPRFTIVVQRDGGHISDREAAALKALVDEIVSGSKMRGAALSYRGVWSALNREMRVPSYRLTPSVSFTAAEQFLIRWRDAP